MVIDTRFLSPRLSREARGALNARARVTVYTSNALRAKISQRFERASEREGANEQKEEGTKGRKEERDEESLKGVRYAIFRVAVGEGGVAKGVRSKMKKKLASKGAGGRVGGGWGWETGVPDDPMARHVWGPQTAGPDS